MALGSRLASFVASRLGKVNRVVFTRPLSVPFTFAWAFSPDSAADASKLQTGTSILGSTWMAGSDFESPFLVAATCDLERGAV